MPRPVLRPEPESTVTVATCDLHVTTRGNQYTGLCKQYFRVVISNQKLDGGRQGKH